MTTLHFNGKTLDLSRPRIMGILNLTPNSFSDGGDFYDPEKALDHAYKMVEDGADILDLGAESTNPKAAPITSKEEVKRLLPVFKKLQENLDVPISIDTFRADTIGIMLAEGADIINDVTGLGDEGSLTHIDNSNAAVILMHMLGGPEKMHLNGDYKNDGGITLSVKNHLKKRANLCIKAGIERGRIVLDPGFGFDKENDDQLSLLKELAELQDLGLPLLVGVSRKRLIGAVTKVEEAKARTMGSVATALWAINEGAQILRVHDVKETKEAFLMWEAIRNAKRSQEI